MNSLIMKVYVLTIIGLIALFFWLGISPVNAAEPTVIKTWMDTGWLVKNKYIRCSKIWYPPNHEPEKTKCFLKYYKPCGGGWCRK